MHCGMMFFILTNKKLLTLSSTHLFLFYFIYYYLFIIFFPQEQEARISFLRNRARQNEENNEQEPEKDSSLETSGLDCNKLANIYTPSGNINFFLEAEAGDLKVGTNEEYEKEKKQEKEAYEKKIGLLTYLGQDTLEATGKTAWFAERDHIVSRLKDKISEDDYSQEIGLKSKAKFDPLNEIIKHTNTQVYPKLEKNPLTISHEKIEKPKSKNLCRKDKKHKKERKRKRKRSSSSDSNDDAKKRKKHSKKRKKKRKRVDSSTDTDDEQEKKRKLMKLREERLAREARERKREERLLAGKDPDVEEISKPDLPYKQKYNSQFNPHLAKQNQQLTTTQSSLQSGVKYWLS